jgi:hypothetical protein
MGSLVGGVPRVLLSRGALDRADELEGASGVLSRGFSAASVGILAVDKDNADAAGFTAGGFVAVAVLCDGALDASLSFLTKNALRLLCLVPWDGFSLFEGAIVVVQLKAGQYWQGRSTIHPLRPSVIISHVIYVNYIKDALFGSYLAKTIYFCFRRQAKKGRAPDGFHCRCLQCLVLSPYRAHISPSAHFLVAYKLHTRFNRPQQSFTL